jgi:Cu/Ag efflux protein CusF
LKCAVFPAAKVDIPPKQGHLTPFFRAAWNLQIQSMPALGLDNERNEMKTMQTYTVARAAMAIMGLAWANPALGDDSCNAAQKEKSFNGSVTAVDAPDKTISVKGFFFTRHFTTAADCKVSLEDKAVASLAELRPGERVAVRYQNAHGVLIARDIVQHDLIYTGHITAIDPAARTLTLKEGVITHNLAIAPDCAVVLKDDKWAALSSLQVGDAVQVTYEPVKGLRMARRIEQKSEMFVGTIEAVDATTRSVKAKDLLSEKKFNLADDCPIVIHGKLNGSLRDLRIGDRVSLNYDNEDGVLVASRISPMTGTVAAAPAAPVPSQTARIANQPPHYGY